MEYLTKLSIVHRAPACDQGYWVNEAADSASCPWSRPAKPGVKCRSHWTNIDSIRRRKLPPGKNRWWPAISSRWMDPVNKPYATALPLDTWTWLNKNSSQSRNQAKKLLWGAVDPGSARCCWKQACMCEEPARPRIVQIVFRQSNEFHFAIPVYSMFPTFPQDFKSLKRLSRFRNLQLVHLYSVEVLLPKGK